MELVIHCGDGKTGTSSIQKHLFERSQELLNHGILYHAPKGFNHFNLKYLAGRKSRVDSKRHAEFENEAITNAQEIRQKIVECKPDIVLLSSESFFTLSSEELKRIIEHFGAHFSRIHCVMYLRDPVKHYISFIQQQIKASYKITSPFHFNRNLYKIACRWRDFVGQENMHIRTFDKKALLSGDVISDFVWLINEIASTTVEAIPAKTFNKSISAEQMILMQEFRRDFLSEQNNVFNPSSDHLLRFFLNVCENGNMPITKPSLKPEFEYVVRETNLDSIRQLDDTFGTAMQVTFWGDQVFEYCDTSSLQVLNVSDVLASYNKHIYDLLKCCIPQYDAAGFESVLKRKVLNDPLVRENIGFKDAFKRYIATVDSNLAKEIESIL